MDVTTLSYVFVLLVAFLGFDMAARPPDVILEAQVVGQADRTTLNVDVATDVLRQEVRRISATPTVMTTPVFRVGRLEGVGMSVAEYLRMESVAYALQAQFGARPDQIKITLFNEAGTTKALVAGLGQRSMASFQQEIALEPGETVLGLVQRASVIGMAHVDPYITALNETVVHADDKDFSHALAIIDYAMTSLPPTPLHFERSLLENLRGIIALFEGDVEAARDWFDKAEASCPDGTVADAVTALNGAFTDLQLDRDAEGVRHLEALLRDKPPTDKVLLATAYMTLAAGRLGTGDIAGADRAIIEAVRVNPDSSSAHDLWADIRRERGDTVGADALHAKALENSTKFENYAEIAALWFRLAWRDHQPVMRSPFHNPGTHSVTLAPHAEKAPRR